MDKKQDVIKTLKKYNQDHIIKLLEKLDMEKQNELIEQIQTINFEQIMELYNNTKKDIEFKESKIEPLKYLDKAKLTEMQRKRFDELGEKAVKNGEYAVVTMAGGQGTRLGHQGPKGTFKLDVFGKGKYLFEILAENLKEANQKYGITIPWYIMTSKENNKQTVEFLKSNNYFGYDKSFVTIFIQSELPLVNEQGKLLIGKDFKIKDLLKMSKNYIISSVIMFGVCCVTGMIIKDNLIAIVLEVLIGIITYFACLIILKEEFIGEILDKLNIQRNFKITKNR